MLKPAVNTKLLIPVSLCSFVAEHGLYKTFELYIYLKCQSSGKIKSTSEPLENLTSFHGWTDKRTIQKHIAKLKQLDWIGYSHKSQTYFIRSFENLQRKHHLYERKSSEFHYPFLSNFRAFVNSTLINSKVLGLKFVNEIARPRKLNTALTKKDGASQCYEYDKKPIPYYGLSNKAISKLLYCSPTTACDQKNAAEKCGFIKTKERLEKILELDVPDYAIRSHLEERYPELRGRLIFKRRANKILVFRQLHDEIIPLIKFKNRKKITGKNLKCCSKALNEISEGDDFYLRREFCHEIGQAI
jgi:hypothetical protein